MQFMIDADNHVQVINASGEYIGMVAYWEGHNALYVSNEDNVEVIKLDDNPELVSVRDASGAWVMSEVIYLYREPDYEGINPEVVLVD